MIRRQSNNEWNGGIAAHTAPKFRVQESTGKVLASIFWDQGDIILINYLPKYQTMKAEYYPSLLVQLKNILKENHCRKITKGVLILHDYAPVHRAHATQKTLAYLGSPYIDHTPYSSVLAPYNYYLFRGLKKQLKGQHFSCETEIIAAAETWLEGQRSEFV